MRSERRSAASPGSSSRARGESDLVCDNPATEMPIREPFSRQLVALSSGLSDRAVCFLAGRSRTV